MSEKLNRLGVDLTQTFSQQSNAERLKRLIWFFAWGSVSWLPRPFSILRVCMLRLFGAKIASHCLVAERVKILKPWNLEVGNFVAIGRKVEIYNYGKVRIGDMSLVSQYCFLCTGSHDYSDSKMPLVWKDITIGIECWIAAGVFVGPGVTIGDGTVVGARSVVFKTLPPQKVCGGNPCKVIKNRILRHVCD